MASNTGEIERLKSDLTKLVTEQQKARIWFFRTGIASLIAAGLWILIYNFASERTGLQVSRLNKESLAIMLGAILMWILFIWAFFLQRKLSRIAAAAHTVEQKLVAILEESRSNPENI